MKLIWLAALVPIILMPQVSLGYLPWQAPFQPTSHNQVLIIDQLAVDAPNVTFSNNVESIFNAANISYDVVNGTNVTVDFYRMLPSIGYGLILIRSHSGLLFPRDPKNPVYLFTGELYKNNRYVEEQLSGALTPCEVTRAGPIYFCIAPLFVSRYMNGTFPGSLILLNGCDTLINTHLADAFLSRGALGFTGWDEYVTAGHMDTAMNHFLEDFVARNMTLAESVQDTVEKVGPDPDYHSDFTFYPASVGSTRITDLHLHSYHSTYTFRGGPIPPDPFVLVVASVAAVYFLYLAASRWRRKRLSSSHVQYTSSGC